MLPEHINLSKLWSNGTKDEWNKAAEYYWSFVTEKLYALEKKEGHAKHLLLAE